MVYDISYIIPNNYMNFKTLLRYIWYPYSNMSVGAVGYDIDYGFGPCLCGGD